MLILVLLLVVVAFGLLVATLVLGETMLAWVSVGVSALAALLLVIDAIRRSRARRRARRTAPPARTAAADGYDDEHDHDYDDDEHDHDYYDGDEFVDEADEEPGDGRVEEVDGEHTEQVVDGRHADPEDPHEGLVAPDEPDVEATPERGLAALAELTDEVVVVDERPRYHLSTCYWLGERATVPLPVYEARELGFSPCAVCMPDLALMARHGV